MYDNDSFWDRLQKVLKSKKVTMNSLSEQLGYNVKTLTIKRSRGDLPTTEDVVRICELLDVSADYLLFEKSVSPELESICKTILELPQELQNSVMSIVQEFKNLSVK